MGSLSARANKVPVVGRRSQGTCRKTGDFFSLDVPLGKACQGICQNPICSSVMDSTGNSPFKEDKAQRALIMPLLPAPQPEPPPVHRRLPPRFPPRLGLTRFVCLPYTCSGLWNTQLTNFTFCLPICKM